MTHARLAHWGLLCAALALPGTAHAERRARALLRYQIASGVEHCPTDAELRAAVGARLGYDPFVAEGETGADLTVTSVHITRNGRTVHGSLVLTAPHPGQRDISSPAGDCREVVDSLATAMAISLDPASLTRAPDAAPEPTEPPAPKDEPLLEVPPRPTIMPTTPPASPPAAKGPRPRGLVTLGLAGTTELPGLAAVGELGIGFSWRALSAAIESNISTKGAREGEGSAPPTAAASFAGAALVPCLHVSIAFGCAVVRGGVVRAEGRDVEMPRRASLAYGSLGVRGGVEIPLSRTFFVRAHLELVVPVTPLRLVVDQQEVWTSPTLAGRGTIGFGARWP